MEIVSVGSKERTALDRIRAERDKCEAELDQVSAAGLSVDEAVERFTQSLNNARERVEYYVTGFARPGSIPEPPTTDGFFGAWSWLDPKSFDGQLRKRLKEVLPQAGTPLASRPAAIAKIKARLVELDEQEERDLCRLEATGLFADRRADVDLAMLLRVWDAA